MKKLILVLIAGVMITAVSCRKEQGPNVTGYDNHSSNMMKSMHSMSADMSALKMTMDPDHDFAMIMKRHHQGAINMANMELANGSDAMIKSMAQKMKDAQAKEIAMLDSFMMAHTAAGMSQPFMDASNAAMKKMDTDADAQKLSGKTDHDFVHLMIIHHQSAIDMANAEIQYGQVAMMKDMAQTMKDDQTKEISELRTWLNAGND
ncbi:MAG: DUF305 domain-containing protein [Chitinophagales bacterium]|nr:DUF305 domain-containing protein [Chitinophagales bacterium]